MTTQRVFSNVPRTGSLATAIPPGIRRAIFQLLGADTLVARTLRASWDAPTVFAVSDFHDASFEWVLKSLRESENGKKVVAVLPADLSTIGGQRALRTARSILFVSGKQIMGRSTIIFGFGVDLSPLGWLGAVITPFKGNP